MQSCVLARRHFVLQVLRCQPLLRLRPMSALTTCSTFNYNSSHNLLVSPLSRTISSTTYLFSSAEDNEKLSRPKDMGKRKTGPAPGEGKGPVSWINLVATGLVLAVLYGAYRYAKNKRELALDKERKLELGKAKIGGSFDLLDHTGAKRTSDDFLGKWIMLYFGFTHCPDICPDEMEKLAKVVDGVTNIMKETKKDAEIVPLFITVDPERDGVKEVAEYIKEFHPRMIGLTGTPEKVKEACKAYRVYFSAGPRDEEEDYIVDHTIIIYLIDPDGGFVDYYGQTKTAEMITTSVVLQMAKYEQLNRKSLFSFS